MLGPFSAYPWSLHFHSSYTYTESQNIQIVGLKVLDVETPIISERILYFVPLERGFLPTKCAFAGVGSTSSVS